ncbi:MAG: LysM peptidoglycan-binding domain-containing protein [Thermodesulfobacteriota bacterium]
MPEPFSPGQIRLGDPKEGDPADKDYSAESAYAYTKDRSETLLSAAGKNTGLFYGLIGTVLFAIIALIIVLPMLMKGSNTQTGKDLENRIKALETKLGEIEAKTVKLGQLTHQDERIDQIVNRVNSMDLAIAQKLDQLNRDINDLRRSGGAKADASAGKHEAAAGKPTPQAAEKPGPAPVKPAAPPEKAASTETKPAPNSGASAVYHTVQPQETIFRISKQYGLSQDELRKLNNLGPNDSIKVGQKLRVK